MTHLVFLPNKNNEASNEEVKQENSNFLMNKVHFNKSDVVLKLLQITGTRRLIVKIVKPKQNPLNVLGVEDGVGEIRNQSTGFKRRISMFYEKVIR